MKHAALILIAILTALLLAGRSAPADASMTVDRVVAVVNDDVITMSDLQRELSRSRGTVDEKLLLEEMINRRLQISAAKKEGMDVTDQELSDAVSDIMRRNNMNPQQFEAAITKEGITLDEYRRELREQMTLSRLFNKYVRTGVTVDPREVGEYYERNRSSYALPEEIRLRQILIPAPPDAAPARTAALESTARTAAERAKKGEDFALLIREYAGRGDGDLGFMERADLLPELARAASDLKAGEIAGPVRTSLGFHVIRLEEVRARVKTLDQVRDDISALLLNQKLENTYRSWLQTLRNDSHIENRL